MDKYDVAHSRVLEWLSLEWAYQRSKFSIGSELERTNSLRQPIAIGSPIPEDLWKQAIDQYYHQGVKVYTLDEIRGRQRLAKALATMVAELTSVLTEFGDLPEPGHSSTEDIKEWLNGG